MSRNDEGESTYQDPPIFLENGDIRSQSQLAGNSIKNAKVYGNHRGVREIGRNELISVNE